MCLFMADHLSADASAAQRYLHSDLRELFRQAQIAARAALLLPLPRAPGSRRPLCGDAGKRAVRSRQRQTRTPQGNRRLVVLQAKAEHILAFSKPWHRFEWRRELWRWNSKPNSSVNCAVSCWPTTSVLPASSACCVINCYPPRNRPSQRPRASARSCRHHSRRNRHRHAVPLARGVCRL